MRTQRRSKKKIAHWPNIKIYRIYGQTIYREMSGFFTHSFAIPTICSLLFQLWPLCSSCMQCKTVLCLHFSIAILKMISLPQPFVVVVVFFSVGGLCGARWFIGVHEFLQIIYTPNGWCWWCHWWWFVVVYIQRIIITQAEKPNRLFF